MRIIADIPNPHCKISVFYMNGKYLVKAEKANLEQTFKIPESELFTGVDALPELFNEAMVARIMERFREMDRDLQAAIASL